MIRRTLTLRYSTRRAINPNRNLAIDHLAPNPEEIVEINDKGLYVVLETQDNSKAFRKNWTRLISKIYEIDPLVCPKCGGWRSGLEISVFV